MKNKYLVTRDREIMLTPLYWNAVSQTSEKSKKIFQVNQYKIWGIVKDGRATQVHLQNYWDEAESTIANNYYSDLNFFNKIKTLIKDEERKIEDFFKKVEVINFADLNINKIIETLNQIKNVWLDFDEVNVPAWFWSSDKYKALLEQELKIEKEDFLAITMPETQTYASQLDYDLLKKSLEVADNEISLGEASKSLSNRYGWLPFGYDGLEYWDEKYFEIKIANNKNIETIKVGLNKIKETAEMTVKKRSEIISKYNFSKQQIDKIEIINQLAIWTDERKRIEFKLHYYYSQGLLELEKRLPISYRELKYLFTEELNNLEKDIEKISTIAKTRINNEFIYEVCNEQVRVLDASEAQALKQEIEAESEVHELKGMVASVGPKKNYKAKVKIVLSPKQGEKIEPGDFLIATMTSPDYIMAMKKASGFITDEGGVTCHAAIVAREMNKPCIIGTKNATKILNDGDEVEIDVSNGIIRIVK